MQRKQLDKWVHGHHEDNYEPPKMYVIGCSDVSQYSLAVEYKNVVEPIKDKDEIMHFESIECAKDELHKLGIEHAYLRLYNTYDECGAGDGPHYYDEEIAIRPH